MFWCFFLRSLYVYFHIALLLSASKSNLLAIIWLWRTLPLFSRGMDLSFNYQKWQRPKLRAQTCLFLFSLWFINQEKDKKHIKRGNWSAIISSPSSMSDVDKSICTLLNSHVVKWPFLNEWRSLWEMEAGSFPHK